MDIVLPEERPSPVGAGLGEDDAALDTGLGDVIGGSSADENESDGLGDLAEALPKSAEYESTRSANTPYVGAQSAEDLDGTVDGDEIGEDKAAEEEPEGRWSARTPSRGNAAGKSKGSTAAPADQDEEDGIADAIGPGPRIPGDKDGLPDISNLEVAAPSESDERGAAGSGRPRGERPEDALRGAVSGQDPATIARAIRTVLKRDDKG